MSSRKLNVGITVGDINGIGPEVIIKALDNSLVLKKCVPIIYGSSKLMSFHKNILNNLDISFSTFTKEKGPRVDRINIVNCWEESVELSLGKMTEEGGKYARIALETAVNDLKDGVIDCLVTGPIHKKAMQLVGFEYPGHTEYLAHEFGSDEYMMTMVDGKLKVAVLSGHIPLSEVSSFLTKESLMKKIKTLDEILKKDFGIDKPLIGIMGLNPHAGDQGVIGKEEIDVIIPVIEECKTMGIRAMGPYGTDGFFGSSTYANFDGILAMYHDQGLIPFKTISQQNGVNYTAGLPIVRTSPDHGTAYDLAGKNKANPASMRNAIFSAVEIYNHRSEYAKRRKKKG